MRRRYLLLLLLLCAFPAAYGQTMSIATQPGSNGTAFGNIPFNGTDHPFSYPLFFIVTNSSGPAATGLAVGAFTGTNSADFSQYVYTSVPAEPLFYQGLAAKCSISSITEAGTTVTVTCASPHNYQSNQRIQVVVPAAIGNGYNGVYRITTTGATTFTFTANSTGLPSESSGMAVAGPYAPCGSTLAAGQSCYVAVKFTPSGTGAESATLNVTGSNFSTLTENLTGTGVTGTAVTACGSLTTTANYYLKNNLTNGATCLVFSGSGVVSLDENGFGVTYGTATTEVYTTDSVDNLSPGTNAFTPVNMTQLAGVPWSIQTGASLLIDSGPNQESCIVASTTGTTFTCTTTKAHNGTMTPFAIVGNPVDGIQIQSNQAHQIYNGSVIQGDCRNPSQYSIVRASAPISLYGGGLGSTGAGSIHDVAISNCSDSSTAIACDYNQECQFFATYYNINFSPNVVTAMRRAEYMDFSCMNEDGNFVTSSLLTIHDTYCAGTSPGGGMTIGIKTTNVGSIYNNYVGVGNPNGTYNGGGITTGVVNCVGTTCTYVSSFLGSSFQPDIEGPDWSLGGSGIAVAGSTICTSNNPCTINSVAPNGLTMTLATAPAVSGNAVATITPTQNCPYNPWTNAAGTSPSNAGGQCTNDYGFNVGGTPGSPATHLVIVDPEGRGLVLTNESGAEGLSNSVVFTAQEYSNNQEYQGCTIGGGYAFEFKQSWNNTDLFSGVGLNASVVANQCAGIAYRAHDSLGFNLNQTSNSTFISQRAPGAANPSACGSDTDSVPGCSYGIVLDQPNNGDGAPIPNGDLEFMSTGDTFQADSCMFWLYYDSQSTFTRRPLLYSPTFVNGSNNSTYHHFVCRGMSAGAGLGPLQGAVVDPTYNGWLFDDVDMPLQSAGYGHLQMYEAFTQTCQITGNGNPLTGATCTFTDGHGNTYTCTTPSNGICTPENTSSFGFGTEPIPPIHQRTNNDTVANGVDNGYNPYTLAVSATGFSPYSQGSITISQDNTWTVNLGSSGPSGGAFLRGGAVIQGKVIVNNERKP